MAYQIERVCHFGLCSTAWSDVKDEAIFLLVVISCSKKSRESVCKKRLASANMIYVSGEVRTLVSTCKSLETKLDHTCRAKDVVVLPSHLPERPTWHRGGEGDRRDVKRRLSPMSEPCQEICRQLSAISAAVVLQVLSLTNFPLFQQNWKQIL